MAFLLNNFVYKEGEDPDNEGLLIPRYKALGRTAPSGERYPDKFSGKADENDLVPVRSIVTKKKGDLSVVTPDLIGTKFNISEGTAIGLSFATSLTEGTTQGALGLKHGGHERVIDKSGYLKAPKACTFREEGNWVYLKVRGGELKYPRPVNIVTLGRDKFEAGESVFCSYNSVSPILNVNLLIELVRANASKGKRYFEKENIIKSECYAYEDGVIHYNEVSGGEIDVQIGNHHYEYNPKCTYYFPDGATVKKFDRICSGLVDMNFVTNVFGNDINSVYTIFRKQFYSITDRDYLTTGLSDLHATQEELVELLFTGLILKNYDPTTFKLEQLEYRGLRNSVLGRKSFYTVLGFGYSSQVVAKAIKGEINLTDDVMTETILGLLINDKLDNR